MLAHQPTRALSPGAQHGTYSSTSVCQDDTVHGIGGGGGIFAGLVGWSQSIKSCLHPVCMITLAKGDLEVVAHSKHKSASLRRRTQY